MYPLRIFYINPHANPISVALDCLESLIFGRNGDLYKILGKGSVSFPREFCCLDFLCGKKGFLEGPRSTSHVSLFCCFSLNQEIIPFTHSCHIISFQKVLSEYGALDYSAILTTEMLEIKNKLS